VYQLGHQLVRYFNVFLSQPKAYLRKEIIATRNLYRKLAGKQSKGTYRDNIRTILTYHLIAPMFFQFMASGLPGLLSDWDDEDKEDMIRASILGNLNALFALGDIIVGIADVIQDKPWAGNMRNLPILSMSESIMNSYKNFKNAIDKEKKQKYLFKILAEIGEAGTGLPLGNIQKLGKNYFKLLSGDVDDAGEAILRLFNYSDYQIEPAKKETEGLPKPKGRTIPKNPAIEAARKRNLERKKNSGR